MKSSAKTVKNCHWCLVKLYSTRTWFHKCEEINRMYISLWLSEEEKQNKNVSNLMHIHPKNRIYYHCPSVKCQNQFQDFHKRTHNFTCLIHTALKQKVVIRCEWGNETTVNKGRLCWLSDLTHQVLLDALMQRTILPLPAATNTYALCQHSALP